MAGFSALLFSPPRAAHASSCPGCAPYYLNNLSQAASGATLQLAPYAGSSVSAGVKVGTTLGSYPFHPGSTQSTTVGTPSELGQIGAGFESVSQEPVGTITAGTWKFNMTIGDNTASGTAYVWILVFSCNQENVGQVVNGPTCTFLFKNYDNTTNIKATQAPTSYEYSTSQPQFASVQILYTEYWIHYTASGGSTTDTITLRAGWGNGGNPGSTRQTGASILTPSGTYWLSSPYVYCEIVCGTMSTAPGGANTATSVKVGTTLGKYGMRPGETNTFTQTPHAQTGVVASAGYQIISLGFLGTNIASGSWTFAATITDTSATGAAYLWWTAFSCNTPELGQGAVIQTSAGQAATACTYLVKDWDNSTSNIKATTAPTQYTYTTGTVGPFSNVQYLYIEVWVNYVTAGSSSTDTVTLTTGDTSSFVTLPGPTTYYLLPTLNGCSNACYNLYYFVGTQGLNTGINLGTTTGTYVVRPTTGNSKTTGTPSISAPNGNGWITVDKVNGTIGAGNWQFVMTGTDSVASGTATYWFTVWNCANTDIGQTGAGCTVLFKNWDNSTNIKTSLAVNTFTYTAAEPAFSKVHAVALEVWIHYTSSGGSSTDTVTLHLGDSESYMRLPATTGTYFYLSYTLGSAPSCGYECYYFSSTPGSANTGTSVKVGTTLGHYFVKPYLTGVTATGTPKVSAPVGAAWESLGQLDSNVSAGAWRFNMTISDSTAAGTATLWISVFSCRTSNEPGCTLLFKNWDNATNIKVAGPQKFTYATAAEPAFPFVQYLVVEYWVSYTVSGGSGTDTLTFTTVSSASSVETPSQTKATQTGLQLNTFSTAYGNVALVTTTYVGTTNPNEVVYLFVCGADSPGGVPLIVDNANLTWTFRGMLSNSYYTCDAFYAIAKYDLQGDAVSILGSASQHYSVTLLAIAGANTANPFDPNLASGPVTGKGVASVSLTTSNSHDISLGNIWVNDANAIGYGSGFTGIASTTESVNDLGWASEYELVTAAQSGLSVSFTNSGINGNSILFADAMVAAAVTQPITITMADSAPFQTVTIAGCSASPASITSPATVDVVMTASCSVTLSFPAPPASTQYVWSTGSATTAVTSCASGTCAGVPLSAYTQYSESFAYALSGGGTPTAPTLTYTSLGSTVTYAETATPTAQFLDYGTSWGITNPLGGSGASERWQADANTGAAVSAGASMTTTYYHQFACTCSYSAADGGSPTPPVVTTTQFGAAYTPALTTTPTSSWFDNSAAWSIPNPTTGSTGTERWGTAAATSGTVSAAFTLAPTYYHQFLQTLSYSVVDGGSPAAPAATGSQFGAAYAPSLATSATGYWFDATGSVAFSTVPGGPGEQWAPSPASVPATASGTQVMDMYHQYQQTVSYSVTGGGAPAAPTYTYTALGTGGQTLTLSGTGQGLWVDATTTPTATNPTTGSTSAERWDTNVSPGTVSSAATIVFAYYHQYQPALQIDANAQSTFDPSMTLALTGTQFGSSGAALCTITTTASATASCTAWVDNGGMVNFGAMLTGAPASSRWENAAGSSSTATISSASTVSVNYYKQYANGFAYSVASGSGYSAPTLSYTALGSPASSTLTTSLSTIYVDSGSSYSATNPLSGSASTERWYTMSPSGSVTSGGGSLTIAYNHQYSLAVSGGNGVTYLVPSPTGDNFWDAGTSLTVSSNGVHGRAAGTGQRVASWNIDGGSNTVVATTGTVTTSTITMSAAHVVSFNSVTQYQVTLDAAAASALVSCTNPTIAGDNYWYDAGSSAGCTLNGVYGRSGGVGTRVASYNWDGGADTNELTAGTFTTSSQTMNSAHQVNANTVTQYQVTLDAGATAALASITSPTISGDNYWYDGATPVTLTLNGVHGRFGGTGTRLSGYAVNGGSNNPVSTVGSVTVLNSISIASAQSVSTTTVVQYLLSLASSPSGDGTAGYVTSPTIPGDTGWYDSGTDVSFSVVANSGFVFSTWSGTGSCSYSGPSEPGSLTMTCPVTETAEFVRQDVNQPFILTVSPSGAPVATFTIGGSCGPSQSTIIGDSQTHVVSLAPSCNFTITSASNGAETQYGFSIPGPHFASSWVASSCGSGTCPPIVLTYYYQVENAYQVTANAQPNFDPGLTFTVTGTYLGTPGQPICSVTPPTSGSTSQCTGWTDYGTPATFSTTASGAPAGSRWVVRGASTFADTTGDNTNNADYYKQWLLTVDGGNAISYSVPSQTGDGYWDYGTVLAVSSDGVWGRSSGSGMRVASWSVDGSPATDAASTGTVTTTLISMTGEHTVSFNDVVQFQLTLDPDATASLSSLTPPPIPGDSRWYDNGTGVTATFDHSWNVVSQDSRSNAIGYSVDGGSQNTVARAGSGTFEVSLVMGSPHGVSVSSVVQYFVLGVGVTLTGSQTGDSWFDAGSRFTVQSAYAESYTADQHYVVNVAPNLMQVITDKNITGISWDGTSDLLSFSGTNLNASVFDPSGLQLTPVEVTSNGSPLPFSLLGQIISFHGAGPSFVVEFQGPTTTTSSTSSTTTSSTSSTAATSSSATSSSSTASKTSSSSSSAILSSSSTSTTQSTSVQFQTSNDKPISSNGMNPIWLTLLLALVIGSLGVAIWITRRRMKRSVQG